MLTVKDLIDSRPSPVTTEVNPFRNVPAEPNVTYFYLTIIFNPEYDSMRISSGRDSFVSIIPRKAGYSRNFDFNVEAALTTVPKSVAYDKAQSSLLNITSLPTPELSKPLKFPENVTAAINAINFELRSPELLKTPSDALPFGENIKCLLC